MSRGNNSVTNKAADGSEKVTIRVKGQDQREMFFGVRRDTKLHKLLSAYCEKLNLDFKSMRFIHNGNRLVGTHTPNKLKMGTHEEIHAFSDQFGGSCGELFTESKMVAHFL